MNALELLREWPTWKRANAETILNSPAWRMNVDYGGEIASIVKVDGPINAPLLSLEVTFDDSTHLLTIGDSPAFPDLHLLSARLAELPPEVVLALVEKECGNLMQTLENVFRRQLRLKRIVEVSAGGTAFALAGGKAAISFAIDLDPAMVQTIGALRNLDVTHESIRSMTRDCLAVYAEFSLAAEEVGALAPGDHLVVPTGSTATWSVELPDDDKVRAVASESVPIPFSAFADGQMPPCPPPSSLRIVQAGRTIAVGICSTLGLVQSICLNP